MCPVSQPTHRCCPESWQISLTWLKPITLRPQFIRFWRRKRPYFSVCFYCKRRRKYQAAYFSFFQGENKEWFLNKPLSFMFLLNENICFWGTYPWAQKLVLELPSRKVVICHREACWRKLQCLLEYHSSFQGATRIGLLLISTETIGSGQI